MLPKTEPRPDPLPDHLIEVLDGVLPAELVRAAWSVVSGPRWLFGHGSVTGGWSRFWKMELDGDPVFDAIWRHVRPRCEELAGAPLRVLRQYANGHTYGMGGNVHPDDEREGTYTFLYYANPEWSRDWGGETVYFDNAGEIVFAVSPRANRGVFFDARIPHAGQAPARIFPGLRVSVAFKLEVDPGRVGRETVEQVSAEKPAPIVIEGLLREYPAVAAAGLYEALVRADLERLGANVRLPGFRPGHVPREILAKHYGKQVRDEAVRRLGMEAASPVLPAGARVLSVELVAGPDAGDVDYSGALEFKVRAVALAELAEPDFSGVRMERLTGVEDAARAAGLDPSAAMQQSVAQFKAAVLDHLDRECRFPVAPERVQQEFDAIWPGVAAELANDTSAEERRELERRMRGIAERRVRLGMVIAEFARRLACSSSDSAALEEAVVEYFLTRARVEERPATAADLKALLSVEE